MTILADGVQKWTSSDSDRWNTAGASPLSDLLTSNASQRAALLEASELSEAA